MEENQLMQKILKGYYIYPLPFSEAAKELLKQLSLELHSPFASLRLNYNKIYPHIDSQPVSEKVMKCYVLYDKQTSNIVQEMLNLNKRFPTLTQARAYFLSRIFENLLGIDSKTLGLEYLDDKDIIDIYSQSVEYLEGSLHIR